MGIEPDSSLLGADVSGLCASDCPIGKSDNTPVSPGVQETEKAKNAAAKRARRAEYNLFSLELQQRI